MAIHINDLKNLKMYRGTNKLFIPLAKDNNKKGSLIYLLTPNLDSSIDMINSPMVINRNWFKSYYVDKSINAIIKSDTGEIQEFVQYEDDTVVALMEGKLSSKDRKKLPDSEFGIPETRSFPLNDVAHVKAAIRMFNHCPVEHEEKLAKRIIKKIKQYGITDIEVSEENRFHEFWHPIKETDASYLFPFPMEYITDYRFTHYKKADEIKKESKECLKIVKNPMDFKPVSEMFTNAKFLVKCYDEEENLAGFAVAYKHPIYGWEYGVYLEDSCFDNDDAKEEITKYLIYVYREYMYSNQGLNSTKRYDINVFSINRDKVLIKNIKLSYFQKNILGNLKKNILGKEEPKTERKMQYPVVTININLFGSQIVKQEAAVYKKNRFPFYSYEIGKDGEHKWYEQKSPLIKVYMSKDEQNKFIKYELPFLTIEARSDGKKAYYRTKTLFKDTTIEKDINNESFSLKNVIGETYLQIGNMAYFPNDDIFYEDAVDNKLRQYMYDDRIRTQKELFDVYAVVKDQCPVIKLTKVNVAAYKGLNLFFDISYYNKLFIDNNNKLGEQGLKVYAETLHRFLNNKSIDKEYKLKTIFIPVLDYYNKNANVFDYTKDINPISTIVRLIKKGNFDQLKKIFGSNDVIFFGQNSYFKVNFSEFQKSQLPKFITNINNIFNRAVPTDDEMVQDSPDAIVTDIVDKLEKSQGIELYGALGSLSVLTKMAEKPVPDNKTKEGKKETQTKPQKSSEPKKSTPKQVKPKDKDDKVKTEKEVSKEVTEKKKEELVAKIQDAAATSTSTEEALDKLDNDEYIANLIQDISDEESTEIKASATRKARINTLSDDLKTKKIKGKSVRELIEKSEDIADNKPLEVTSANINSINNDQWDNLQYINFNEEYDVDEDIMAILNFFSTRTVPVGIRDVQVENTTTSEDLKETWTVQCEDISGTRFNLKFDIPLLKNNRFMRIKGNDKTINAQLMNLPIIKTESDTAQITTNYNKIFFYQFGSAIGKSNVVTGKLIKALDKYTGKSIITRNGSNNITALKYEIPMDYADIGKGYVTISYKGTTFYFDQDEIREKYADKIDLSKGLPIGYDGKQIIYSDGSKFCASIIVETLYEDKEFAQYYDEAKPSVKYAYSQASILNTKIPVIVICAYCEGLIKTLNKAMIEYKVVDKREKVDVTEWDMIKFSDGYIYYKINYNSSLLMNGLKECNTESYSIKDINTKTMWTEQLDHFGGRIKADGLDNFYDLMFDPITKRVCKMYKLPEEFCEGLIYSNNLLSDTKFNKHTDISGNRFRTNEIIAGYAYKELAKSYADYRTKLKKQGKATMTIKQSAIIDAIMADSTASDASTINDLWYAEANNTVSFKGLSGLNSDRSYSLEKRTFDESMINTVGMSTGFAGTVGVSRVATTNANVNGKRGYISGEVDKNKMNDVNTMTTAENLTPMCTTHDDPFRLAMSYVQRTKHDMRVAGGDPLLITNGMDDALSVFTPDVFTFNAKQDGRVIERDDDHIVVQYGDGSIDYVDLNNKVYKNSDGGFYTSIKLEPAKGLGKTVKKGQLIAYDPQSYTVNCGYDDSATYNQGTFAKIAIITSDKGFEDSCVVSSYLSDALSSNVIMEVPVTLSKNTNVFNMVKPGDKVQEGDPLLIIQNTFEDNDVNVLLKNLVDDEDTVTSLGRIPIKSHNTGYIEDIRIYRTCELDEMSPSLKKIVTEYEKKENKRAAQVAKYDETLAKQYKAQKLEQDGKLKGVEDGVLIEIFVSYKDDFSVGDKLIFLGAQKGVAKEVIPAGQEPTSSYRPNEPIDAIASMLSFDKRMCCAPLQYTLIGKGLVELDRQVKDIMGIKQEYSIRHDFK